MYSEQDSRFWAVCPLANCGFLYSLIVQTFYWYFDKDQSSVIDGVKQLYGVMQTIPFKEVCQINTS